MNTNRVTLEDQLQRLEGLKTMLEDIRHNLMTYLITQPKDLLDSLRDSGFTAEVADHYEKKFLEPDNTAVSEIERTIISPSIDYIDNQIAGIKRILNSVSPFY
ncbi:hypothetical protein [uncultured Muribaculum sp.]|uniref:hypothetical protein n=1 Tax=uncultured Muribaculum sp. TaxID=1918613 RepID=UPI0026E57354|nr:hypothetical protein [uncultured Muribaculum sp.]